MKRAFLRTAGSRLVSALVPKHTPNPVCIGDRITVSRTLDLGYYATIAKGEQGTVEHIDPDSGLIEVLLDHYHKELSPWDNHLWLEPFGTEDIIDGIICGTASVLVYSRRA